MRFPLPLPRGRRAAAALILVALCCCLVIAGGPPVAGQSPAPPSALSQKPDLARGSRIPWQGGSYFLSGLNYPQYLYYGGDIATLSSVDPECVWSYSSAFDYAALDADFAEMQANGVHVVRWWLFGDGRGAPEFDAQHMVTGLDATFFDHMDQAMEIAAHHNIYIIWSLWDFLAFEHANWLCGGAGLAQQYDAAAKLPPAERDAYLAHLKLAQAAPPGWLPGTGDSPASGQSCMTAAGGHRNIVTDTAPGGAQDAFFTRALVPMLQRYANDPNVIAWEIMNEPEWTLNPDAHTGNQYPTVQEPVDLAQMRQFFARFTAAVHQYAPNQYATVGAASLKFMGFGQYIPAGIWSGLGFDFYGVHYYGWMDSQPYNNGDPVAIDYNSTAPQLDAPVVIGELPANGGTAPLYLPSVRSAGSERSTLDLRYICGAYAPANEPPCTRPYTATIEYTSDTGAPALTQTVVLSPYGGWTGQVPLGGGSFTGAARIVSNGPLAAVVTQTGMLSAGEETAYTGQDKANLTVWLPRVTNQGTHRSRIAVQNTDIHTATVTINYYNLAGAGVASDTVSLGPRASTLIDPLLGGPPTGPPAGFQGSAVVVGSRPVAAVVYDLDPTAGSDAYPGEGQGYLHDLYLPSVRNWGATNGDPTLYVQNPCCAAAQDTIRYYNSAGALVASQTVNLPANGAAVVSPQAVLPGGFEGAAILTSDQFPAAVMRSTTLTGTVSTVVLYAGTQDADQRLHFPVVHNLNADGSGQVTSLAAQNVSASQPITVWLTLNDLAGNTAYFSSTITIPPHGERVLAVSNLPGVPAGFSGTAEILWPFPNGWSEGFPLIATARDLDGAHTHGETYRGAPSHSSGWAVTAYTPEELLDGIYDQHWAGALAWSYYDGGTGAWGDYYDAARALDAAHPADLGIGVSQYTPVPTPANSATATALAATNTPAYGNGATATAVAQLSGTPQPTCVAPTSTPTAIPCAIQFSDVHPTDYFYTPVQYLYCRGIVSGYNDGTFRPYNDTTRAQFSKMLVLARGWSLVTPGVATFNDVPVGSPFFAVVETAYAHGAVSGYGCGAAGEPCPGRYFRPTAYVTRGQISKLIALAMGWPLLNPATPSFRDVPSTYPFYQAIETVYARGVISGYGCGTGCREFRPAADATRGQLSKMLWLAVTQP